MKKEEAQWLFGVLRNVRFFASFSIADIDSLLDLFIKYSFRSGKKIIREGEKGEAFYLIFRGTVDVRKKTFLMFSKRITQLGDGNFFGEMSLLSDDPTTATVKARGPVEVFALPRRVFLGVIEGNAELQEKIKDIAEARKLDTQLSSQGT